MMPTKIPYADETLNASVGCSHSGMPGCDNCWAADLHWMRHKAYVAGKKVAQQYAKPFNVVQLMPERLERILHWRKPRRIFWCAMSDLFHEDVPDDFRASCFDTMASWRWPNKAAQREGDDSQLIDPGHTHLILTKRPERIMPWLHWMDQFWPGDSPFQISRSALGHWPGSIWLGISCSTQDDLDKMSKYLFQIRAAHYWLSLEPLLEEIYLPQGLYNRGFGYARDQLAERISWTVIGCESIHRKPGRFCADEKKWWNAARDIVRACRIMGSDVYLKQGPIGGRLVTKPKDFPEDMRIREVPK